MKKLLFVVLGFVHLGLFSMQRTRPLQGLNIKFLKGTHTVVPDSDYAPFWGLTFIENDIAKQWYVLSARQIGRTIRNSLAQVADTEKVSIVKLLSEKKNTFTQDLVMQMFHMAGGTFNVTNAPNNPVRQLTPHAIGGVLRIVHGGAGPADLKLQQETLEQYLVKLSYLDLAGKPFKAKDFRPFVKALVGALGECRGDTPLYAKNTTQGLLLGYMLAKSNSRADLQEYFRGFLGDDTFVLQHAEYSVEEFKELVDQVPDLSDIESFANYFCAVIYTQKYASALPKIVSSTNVSYEGNGFTNCVEATMSNLANIVTYNAQDKKLGKAPEGITLSPELQAFYGQELHASSADVDNQAVHQAWIALLENQVGAAYNRLVERGKIGGMEVRNQCDGVIPVDTVEAGLSTKEVMLGGKTYQLFQKQVGNRIYWLVPKGVGLDCFELMPTAANVIVTMNCLFDLKLYTSIDDVLKADFVENYFSKMCDKLGWQVDSSILRNLSARSGLEIPVTLAGGEIFTIHMHDKAHAYVSVKAKNTLKGQVSADSFNGAAIEVQAACVGLGIVKNQAFGSQKRRLLIQYAPALNLDVRLSLITYMLPVHGDIVDVLYLSQLIMSMGSVDDMHYATLISKSFIKRIGDLSVELVNAFGIMADTLYVRGKDVHTMCNYINVASQRKIPLIRSVVQFMQKVEQDQQSSDLLVQRQSMKVLNELVEQKLLGQVQIGQVMQCVKKGLQTSDKYVQELSIKVLNRLVEQKLLGKDWLSQVMQWVEKGLQSSDAYEQYQSMKFLNGLVEQKLLGKVQVGQMMQWVEKGMQSFDSSVQHQSMQVLNKLVEQKLLGEVQVGQMMQLVEKGMQSFDRSVQHQSMQVLNKLVEQKLLGEVQVGQMMQWVEKGMQSFDSSVQHQSMQVLNGLVKQKLFGEDRVGQVMQCVEKGMQFFDMSAQNKFTQDYSMDVLNGLVEQKLLNVNWIDQMMQSLEIKREQPVLPREERRIGEFIIRNRINSLLSDLNKLKNKLELMEQLERDVKAPSRNMGQSKSSMLKFNRSNQPDAKFVAEAKRQYSTRVDEMRIASEQKDQMALIDQERTHIDEQREQLPRFNEQTNQRMMHRDLALPKVEPISHRPGMASAEMIAASRAAARRALPRVARGVIR